MPSQYAIESAQDLGQANALARSCIKCGSKARVFYEPGCMVAECEGGCYAVTLPEWNADIYKVWNARYGKDLK